MVTTLPQPGSQVAVRVNGVSVPATVRRVVSDDTVRVRFADGTKSNVSLADLVACQSSASAVVTPEVAKFDVNTRFRFLRQLVDMVTSERIVSMVCTGEGGLGKSYTVMQGIKEAGLVEEEDYVVLKGHCSPRALYETLYNNSDKLVVFDDCDSVLKDDKSVNILKAALDSYERRMVTWSTSARLADEDFEPVFEFTGKIIFISNQSQSRVDQAILSRSINVDLSMTTDEKLTRMEFILPFVAKDTSMSVKHEALALIRQYAPRARELSLRTLLKTISIRAAGGDWKSLAEYVIVN